MYDITIWYFYILRNDHHDKSSYHLSPYKVMTILLTIFSMLYISSLWLIYFVTGSLYLLIPITYFTSPVWQPHFCSLYLWVCFCFVLFFHLFCFLNSTYKWNQTVFVFLCLVTLLSIIPLHPSMSLQMARFHSFLWLSNIPYIYIYITSSLSIHLSVGT